MSWAVRYSIGGNGPSKVRLFATEGEAHRWARAARSFCPNVEIEEIQS